MEPQTNTIAMVLVNAVIVTVAALYVILVRTLSVQLVTDVENAVTAMVQVNAPIATAQERDNDNRLYQTARSNSRGTGTGHEITEKIVPGI